MTSVELIIALLILTAALAWLASRLRVPYPIFLTLGGLALSLLPRLSPNLRNISLDPEVVFLLFLPPLLYYAGLLTTWRDFKQNIRPISMLAVGLVFFTTALVAIAAHYLLGMPWAPAFVLGAIVSPPDAVAATAITQRLPVPKRIVTVLEGESLLNDASALIAYRFAISAVAVGSFSLTHAAMQFVVAAAGGIALGFFIGKVMAWVRQHLNDAAVEGMVSLLIPYVAFLPAEWLHLSGVLSTVTAGVYIGRRVPQITTSHTRLRLYAVWETVVFLLNGLIFILIGLQLPAVIQRLDGTWPWLIRAALIIAGTAIVVRMVWVFPAAYLPRLLPSIRQRDPMPKVPHIFLVSWIGLRGIVSLAAALALPVTSHPDGPPFPDRDLIIFLTFSTILVTLVGQGLTLPLIIRWLRVKGDDVEKKEEETARLELANAALARLQVMEVIGEAEPDLIRRVRQPYEQRLRYYGPRRRGLMPIDADAVCRTTNTVLRNALQAEREMLVRLRDDNLIGDDVLRRIQTDLDLQEARLDDDDGEDGDEAAEAAADRTVI